MTSPHQEPADGFGDVAGEAPQDTEVEATLREEGAPAPATGDGAVDGAAVPERGAPADPDAAADPGVPSEGGDESAALGEMDDELAAARGALSELTGDLQRLQAEFVNYKKRVERDRQLIAENATYKVLTPIVDVLDTIDRAREHGDLDPGFQAVADQLEGVVGKLGLVKFGAVGDPFDPMMHEALSHLGEDPDVSVQTCKVIAKSGYKIGDRVVRAAQVLVVDPAS